MKFVILVLAQVLVFNQINVGGWVNPYIYPLLILLLPFETPSWAVLLIAFATGLTVDIFMGTIGMHAAALIIVAFVRPLVFNILNPRQKDAQEEPNIGSQGIGWFAGYAALMLFIHHLAYFFIETGNLYNSWMTLLKVVLSLAVSLALIIIIELLYFPGSRRRYA